MSVTKLTIYNSALTQMGGRRLATVTDNVDEQRAITAVYDDLRDEVLSEHAWSFAQKRATLIEIQIPSVEDWETAKSYAVDDEVEYITAGSAIHTHYTCLIAHTSDVFTVDLVAAKWVVTTDWVTATSYALSDQVYNVGVSYSCIVAHTSGTFATDLDTNVYWIASEKIKLTEDGIEVIYKLPSDYIRVSLMSDVNATAKFEGERMFSNRDGLSMIYTYRLDTPSLYSALFRVAFGTRIAAETAFDIVQSVSKAEKLLEKYHTITLPNAMALDSQQGTPLEQLADVWFNARIAGSGAGTAPRIN